MSRRKLICPKCGSTNALNIIYGMPAPEAVESSRRDEVILDGCSVLPDSALYICRDCNYEWGKYCKISILPSIIYIKAYVGGFWGPNCSIEADALKGKLKRSYTHCDQEEFIDDVIDITPEAWKALLRALKNCDFEYWVDKYEDPHICDGTQWSVEVQLDTGKKIKKWGSNIFPGRWKQFCRAMSKLAGVPFG